MTISPAEARRRATLEVIEREIAWREAAASLTLGPPDPELAKAHLLEFVRWGQPNYKVGFFHRELCAELERFSRDVIAGKSPRLLIAAPPRHGKSEIVSRRFPVWHLARAPHHEVVVASYGQDLANRMSRNARAVRAWATDWWPALAPRVGGTDGVELWEIAGGGSYKAVGVGGPLTGDGAHCFPAGTMVSTPSGKVAIESVVAGDSVWTCDSNGGILSGVVVAISERTAHDFVEVRFASGRVVRSTPEHRFFVRGAGYTAAEDLRVGDPTCAAPVSLPDVWWSDVETSGDVSRLLREGPPGGGAGPLRALSDSGVEEGLRASKVSEARRTGGVLLARMPGPTLLGAAPPEVPAVRCADADEDVDGGPEGRAVLLSGLREGRLARAAQAVPHRVSDLPDDLLPDDQSEAVLLQGLREPGALGTDARGRELVAPQGRQPEQAVPRHSAGDLGARRASVPRVLGDLGAMRASYRRGPGEQCAGEPDHAVRPVPHAAPQVEVDPVSVVRRVRGGGEPVYDIEVADHHCFFANDILVHNCLIVDDPFKNREEADSETTRASRWLWFTETAYTRLAPGGGIMAMATRWHESDISGRILSELAAVEGWRVVSFPALAEVDEPFRRAGEALHPERYTAEYLEQVRVVIGSRAFAALYQQRPSPAGGAMFLREWLGKRFHHDPQRPTRPYTQIVISVDATFKGTDGTDYVSMGVWGRYDWLEYHRLDQVRARMSYVVSKQALRDLVTKWRPAAVLIETKANGEALLSDLKKEIPGLIGRPPDPHGNKVTRASIATPRFEAGEVYLPAGVTWVSDYVEELASFPQGAHDDMVDDTSQVFLWWQEQRSRGGTAALNAMMAGLLGRR